LFYLKINIFTRLIKKEIIRIALHSVHLQIITCLYYIYIVIYVVAIYNVGILEIMKTNI